MMPLLRALTNTVAATRSNHRSSQDKGNTMSHSVVQHHVVCIAIPQNEQSSVKAGIQDVNQFILDNYDIDEGKAAYIATAANKTALFPINVTVISDFLLALRLAGTMDRTYDFRSSLEREMRKNGIDIRNLYPDEERAQKMLNRH